LTYLCSIVTRNLAKGLVAINDGVVHNLCIRQQEATVGWKQTKNIFSGRKTAELHIETIAGSFTPMEDQTSQTSIPGNRTTIANFW